MSIQDRRLVRIGKTLPEMHIVGQLFLIKLAVKHVVQLLEDPPSVITDLPTLITSSIDSVEDYIIGLRDLKVKGTSESARAVVHELGNQLKQLFPCGTSVKEWNSILAAVLAAELALRNCAPVVGESAA